MNKLAKDKHNRKIDDYLEDPIEKSAVLLDEMEDNTDISRDELIWRAVQILWCRYIDNGEKLEVNQNEQT